MSRRTYHHGDLRETLVRAALDLIREKGHAGFTFADAARLAGVSPAAPYRHFRDRDELMADIARRGFELFEAALAKAWNHGQPDPLRALQRMGAAYLDFARTEASYYATMFEAGIPAAAHPALGQAGERAFGVLLMAAESLTPLLPAQGRPPRPYDRAAYLGAFAWGCRAVRAGRRRAARFADAGPGSTGGRRSGLSARAWPV